MQSLKNKIRVMKFWLLLNKRHKAIVRYSKILLILWIVFRKTSVQKLKSLDMWNTMMVVCVMDTLIVLLLQVIRLDCLMSVVKI